MKQNPFVNRLKCYRELNNRNKNFVNIDLYKLLLKEDALVAGYEKIKKGATTPGSDGTSLDLELDLDSFSRQRLEKLRDALRNQSWQPNPFKRKRKRRIYTTKQNESEKRPLQGPEEKIVQAVMLMILESIYEPIFLDTSFGWRPGKSVNNALKVISQQYDGMTFAIEGEIKGMYDNINHHTLVGLLRKRIKDERFIRLTWKMLRAGYLEVNKPSSSTFRGGGRGTPQGSIVSPILVNIYLHELDIFMKDKCLNLPTSHKRIRTPASEALDNKIQVIKRRLPSLALKKREKEEERLDSVKALKPLITKTSSKSLRVRTDLNPKNRISYQRYADDFIIGVAGSFEFTNQLKGEIKDFLATLHLNKETAKTKITNIRKEPALFLGHIILIDTSIRLAYVRPKGQSRHLKRVPGKLVKVQAPIPRIVNWLSAKGFCDRKGFPTSKKLWITQEDNQIIQNFNATCRDLFSYYSGVNNKSYLQRIWYILKFSCAHTLANKHRCSLHKVFAKHGPQLKVNFGSSGEKSIALDQPITKAAG